MTAGCRKLISSTASASSDDQLLELAKAAKALVSRGKHGPPNPKPGLKYLRPILESWPIASAIMLGSVPGIISVSSAI